MRPEIDLYRTFNIQEELALSSEVQQWPGNGVAFACWANHGRSQMAEALFRTYYPGVDVISGGSISRPNEYPNNMPNPIVVEVLNEHQIETDNLKVKQLDCTHVTQSTDLFVFVDPNLFKNELLRFARSVIFVPFEDPSVNLYVWGKQPPIDKQRIVDSFLLMQDFIQNKVRNIVLGVRTLESELSEKGIHYPVSKIFRVSGDTIMRTHDMSYI